MPGVAQTPCFIGPRASEASGSAELEVHVLRMRVWRAFLARGQTRSYLAFLRFFPCFSVFFGSFGGHTRSYLAFLQFFPCFSVFLEIFGGKTQSYSAKNRVFTVFCSASSKIAEFLAFTVVLWPSSTPVERVILLAKIEFLPCFAGILAKLQYSCPAFSVRNVLILQSSFPPDFQWKTSHFSNLA